MTVSTTDSQISYTGDNSSVNFPFPFYFLVATDIQVYINGVAQTSGFTVTGAGNQDGGMVSFVTAPAAGSSIILVREPDALQSTHFPPNDPFPAAANEMALDKLTMLIQLALNKNTKSISFPIFETFSGTLANASARASSVLAFDSNGALTYVPLTAPMGAGDMRVDTFVSGSDFTPGVTTQLTLSRAAGTPANVEVFFDGFYQGPDQWVLNGTLVTFFSPIPLGVSKVFIRTGTTLSVYAPPAQSVGDTELKWGNVLAREVGSVAELKTLNKLRYQYATLDGYYSSGDGCMSRYRLDLSDTTSAGDDFLIVVAADGGRWKLVHNGWTTLRQAGCHPNLSDNAARLQVALNALTSGISLIDTGGTYLVSTVQFPAQIGMQFRMAGKRRTVFQAVNPNQVMFSYAGPANTAADGAVIGGFTIKAHASGSTTPAFKTSGFRDSTFYDIEGLSTNNKGFYSLIDASAWPYLCHKNVYSGMRIDSQTGWTKGIDFNTGGSGDGINNANICTIELPWFVGNTGMSVCIDVLRSTQTSIFGGLIEGNNGATYINMGKSTHLRGCWLEFYAGQTGKHLDFNNVTNEGQASKCLVTGNYFYPAVTIDYHNLQVGNTIAWNNFSSGVTFVNQPGNGTANLFIDTVEQYDMSTPVIAYSAGVTGTLAAVRAVQTKHLDQFLRQQSFALTYSWAAGSTGPTKFNVTAAPAGYVISSISASSVDQASGAPAAVGCLDDGSIWIANPDTLAKTITVFVTYTHT